MAEVDIAADAVKEMQREGAEGVVKTQAFLMTTVLALLTALAGMLAGARNNEATLKMILMSDRIGSVERSEIRGDLRMAMRGLPGAKAMGTGKRERVDERVERDNTREEARVLERESRRALVQHEDYARATMLFQLGILMSSAASVFGRRMMLGFGGIFGVVGLAFFVVAMLL